MFKSLNHMCYEQMAEVSELVHYSPQVGCLHDQCGLTQAQTFW